MDKLINNSSESGLIFILLQLVFIVLVARLGGKIAEKFGQTNVVGQIIAGIVMGPTLFGALAPDLWKYIFASTSSTPISMMSHIGVILLMFEIGLEFDFNLLCANKKKAAVGYIALAGIAVPFLAGFGLGKISYSYLAPTVNELSYALFMGTAFCITAVPVLGRILAELRLARTLLGSTTMAAAALSDVLGWSLLAVVVGLTTANFSALGVARHIVVVALYVALCIWIVRPMLVRAVRLLPPSVTELSINKLALLVAGLFLFSMVASMIGLSTIFGALLFGMLLSDQPILVDSWRTKVKDFAEILFVPLFFTYTGLRCDIGGFTDVSLWLWCVAIVLVASVAKYGACYGAARGAGFTSADAKAVGILMNTRGLMELVVINIGYDLGVIPKTVFTMLVVMAILTTALTTPLMRCWLSHGFCNRKSFPLDDGVVQTHD